MQVTSIFRMMAAQWHVALVYEYLKPATWRCSLKYSACPLAEAEGIISQSFAPLDHIYFLCFRPQTTPTVVVGIFEFRRPADFFSVVFRPHPNRKLFDPDCFGGTHRQNPFFNVPVSGAVCAKLPSRMQLGR